MPLRGSKVASKSASAAASSSSNRRRRRQSTMQTSSERTIQKIYDISKDVFAAATPGFVPLPSDVTRLCGFLNSLTLQDIGLDATMPYFRANPSSHRRVTYLHFGDTSKLSFGVFCFPQSVGIPLHDHPGMTVFSKILLGSMHIKSYDWVKDPLASIQDDPRKPNGARLAKLNTDATFDASSETVVLYPEGGNMHCFTAMSPCAVLDVMGPPYGTAEEGRDCSYYGSRVVRAAGDGQYSWLKKVPSFRMEVKNIDVYPNIRK